MRWSGLIIKLVCFLSVNKLKFEYILNSSKFFLESSSFLPSGLSSGCFRVDPIFDGASPGSSSPDLGLTDILYLLICFEPGVARFCGDLIWVKSRDWLRGLIFAAFLAWLLSLDSIAYLTFAGPCTFMMASYFSACIFCRLTMNERLAWLMSAMGLFTLCFAVSNSCISYCRCYSCQAFALLASLGFSVRLKWEVLLCFARSPLDNAWFRIKEGTYLSVGGDVGVKRLFLIAISASGSS